MDSAQLQIVAAVAGAVIFGAPAARLSLLSIREPKAPHGYLALSFGMLATSAPLRLISGPEVGLAPAAARSLNALSYVAATVSIAALYLFVYKAFRPSSPRVKWGVALGILGSAAVASGITLTTFVGGDTTLLERIASCVNLVPIVWMFVESTSSYRRMRRQQLLGLGDPVVTNRFLLWSIWSGCLTTAPIAAIILGLIRARVAEVGHEQAAILYRVLYVPMLGLFYGCAVALWLSFFPGATYLRMLRRSGTNDR